MNQMWNLLSLEIKKFKNNAVVDLFGLMFLITMPTLIFIGKEFRDLPPPIPSNTIFFTFPGVWSYLGFAGNWLVFFFLGFIVLYVVTSEVDFKTMRQNIITGLSRRDFFLAKLYVVLSLSLFATLYYVLIALAIGYFHNDPYSFEGAFDNEMAIPRYFIMCLGYTSFALLIGFFIRRSGIAIFFYLCYVFFIEAMLKWFVHFKLVKNASINYWPLNATEDLMPFPPYTFVDNIPRKDLDFSFLLPYNHAMIATSIYVVLFIGVAYWSFSRRDI